MSIKLKLGLGVVALFAGVYLLSNLRGESKSDKKFDAYMRAAWDTCKGTYPEGKGDAFADCVGRLMAPHVFFPEKD